MAKIKIDERDLPPIDEFLEFTIDDATFKVTDNRHPVTKKLAVRRTSNKCDYRGGKSVRFIHMSDDEIKECLIRIETNKKRLLNTSRTRTSREPVKPAEKDTRKIEISPRAKFIARLMEKRRPSGGPKAGKPLAVDFV